MKRSPTDQDPIKELVQQHGLHQPSAAFSTALTRLVVARYALPPVVASQPKAWVGSALVWLLTAVLLLLFGWLAPPAALLSTVGVPVCAFVVGLGGLFWLVERHTFLPRPPAISSEQPGLPVTN